MRQCMYLYIYMYCTCLPLHTLFCRRLCLLCPPPKTTLACTALYWDRDPLHGQYLKTGCSLSAALQRISQQLHPCARVLRVTYADFGTDR